jgi:hypothetical protein
MNTKLKCSNCGAEISTLNFGTGKWMWLIYLVGLLPLIFFMNRYCWQKGDYRQDLQATVVEARVVKDRINVVAKVRNVGKHDWQNVEMLAEIYGKDGKFLTQQSQRLAGAMRPGEERQFRLVLFAPSDEQIPDAPKVVLKPVDAVSFSF